MADLGRKRRPQKKLAGYQVEAAPVNEWPTLAQSAQSAGGKKKEGPGIQFRRQRAALEHYKGHWVKARRLAFLG